MFQIFRRIRLPAWLRDIFVASELREAYEEMYQGNRYLVEALDEARFRAEGTYGELATAKATEKEVLRRLDAIRVLLDTNPTAGAELFPKIRALTTPKG